MAFGDPQSTGRIILAVVLALPTASWTLVGVLWIAYLIVQANAAAVRGSSLLLPVAIAVIFVALALAVGAAWFVFRAVRGRKVVA